MADINESAAPVSVPESVPVTETTETALETGMVDDEQDVVTTVAPLETVLPKGKRSKVAKKPKRAPPAPQKSALPMVLEEHGFERMLDLNVKSFEDARDGTKWVVVWHLRGVARIPLCRITGASYVIDGAIRKVTIESAEQTFVIYTQYDPTANRMLAMVAAVLAGEWPVSGDSA